MGFLAGFAPWIVFWVLAGRHGNEQDTLLVACLVALGVSLLSVLGRVRSGTPISSLDVGSIIFFAGFGIVSQLANDDWLIAHNQFVSNTALLAIVLVGSLTRRPFTLAYAKATTPESVWDDPNFLRVNETISWVWVATFAVMAVSSGILLLVDETSTSELILNWVIPFGALAICIAWMNHYITSQGAQGRAAAESGAEPAPAPPA
jgi:hypothetical protein